MSDKIFTNTTPHGLLRVTDPETADALEAWPHGWVVWYDNDRWGSRKSPIWHPDAVYRARPAPVRITRWHNLYANGNTGGACATREGANQLARLVNRPRVAVLRIDMDEDGANRTYTEEPV